MDGDGGVMVMNGKGKFIEADATIARLLTSQGNELLIPRIKYAMYFYIQDLPS